MTGLPPTDADYKRTYAENVDRLLASPEYGERWARYWLDVVRFGETDGGEHNFERFHAWRYRDWVIDAFNRDMPYTQFVREQITGDLLRPKDPQSPKYVAELVDWGAGPRAGQFLIQGGKAMAAMDGRFSVSLDDIRRVAVPVLRHRIATNFQAQAEGLTSESIIDRLLRETPEPEIPKLVK